MERVRAYLVRAAMIACAAALVHGSAAAQDPNLAQFQRSRLSLEVSSEGVIAGYGFEQWRSWSAYRGFESISEPELFELTGFRVEANKARSHYRRGNALGWTGVALAIGGLATTLAGPGNPSEDGRRDAAIAGLSLTTVGTVMAYLGSKMTSKRWAPASVVQPIVEEYNHGLAEELGVEVGPR